ncbi:MAG TPA: nucleoside diphosphate kinase regulator [Syntrophorhabdaceae bacterium]|nr:nucleoside diphosphate kinase regulator [Syntrophorhabdaceae bacterium]
MKKREIYITQNDMERLRALIEIYNGNDAPYLERLEEELDSARIVDSKDIPHDVVTMNSIVRIKDLDTGEERTLTLVFPGKTDAAEKTISILAPVGTALIGYREGDAIEWRVPAGTKKFKIIEIIYQPERLGNYDL